MIKEYWDKVKGFWPWVIVRGDYITDQQRTIDQLSSQKVGLQKSLSEAQIKLANTKIVYGKKLEDAGKLMSELRLMYVNIDRNYPKNTWNVNISLTEEMFHMYRYEDMIVEIIAHHVATALRREGARF